MYDVRLVDADDNEVPDGTPGEVSIRGAALFSGYWNNDEANAHDFRGGRFHMGDVLRRDESGRLEYVDRVKYMIKSGGENIYPAEIENVLAQCAEIVEAAVIGMPDSRWGEVAVAAVVTRPGSTLDEAAVLQLFEGRLARYKRPRRVVFMASLPKTALGKVQKAALRAALES
jgi:fatty-acyl-CoA synthase